ncbi:hypothetical protein KOW79_008804 [Hemibagrus wyckioides]|uniref:Pro-adrenomedullin n=1 Tax=Hemibagrus wyckioides TaxID=337641 RepID=A0A9D3SPU3_9TELE|nr:hypothetical protein KOW79_008804 [Hemibagrus wyckioides]
MFDTDASSAHARRAPASPAGWAWARARARPQPWLPSVIQQATNSRVSQLREERARETELVEFTASVRTRTKLLKPNLNNPDFSQNESDCFVLLLLLLSAADCHTQRGQCKTQPQPSFKEKHRDTLLPHSSTGFGVRTKRSKNSVNQSRRSGCSLGTCTVHDLAHRLHQLNNKLKVSSAPIDKISPLGYGRRRRSVPEMQMKIEMQGGHLQPVWRLHKLEALLRRT